MSNDCESGYIVGPVSKALAVLTYIAERRHPVSLTTVSTALGIPKTSAFRYLRTLAQAGFIDHDGLQDRYGLGTQFHAIARANAHVHRLREQARPAMRALMGEFNETINLAVKDAGSVVYVDQVEPLRSLQMRARIGDVHPLHSTALGKAILAFVPAPELRDYLERPLSERTGRTLIETEEIERQLRQVRSTGYATESGENEDGALCVGVALFDGSDYPVAALSISAPLHRMSRSLAAKAGIRLLEVAGQIAGGAGHH